MARIRSARAAQNLERSLDGTRPPKVVSIRRDGLVRDAELRFPMNPRSRAQVWERLGGPASSQ